MSYVSKNPRFNSQILTDQGTSSVDDPASGSHKIVNRNGLLYMRDSSGNETAIGSAGATGGINYIDNPSAETGIDGWDTYADAAGTTPVDGTGGSANVTFNRTTTAGEILRGDASFELTVPANSQGEGFSYDFTIDKADQNKVLGIWFDVDATDANYDDDNLQVFIYDKDQSQLITPTSPTNGYKIKGNQYRNRVAFAPYDTSSNDYRLIIHVASDNASGYSVRFDNFEVGPGAIMTGFDGIWKTYTTSDVSVTSSQAGWSVDSSKSWFQPQKDTNGDWWLNFSIEGSYTAANVSSVTVTIAGLSFANTEVISGGLTTNSNITGLETSIVSGSSVIVAVTSTGNTSVFRASGFVKLTGKPTWADFDPIATIYPTTDDLAYAHYTVTEQDNDGMADNTFEDIDSGTVTVPAGEYTIIFGAFAYVLWSSAPSYGNIELRIHDSSDAQIGPDTSSGIPLYDSNDSRAVVTQSFTYTFTQETTLNLNGRIAMNGGTISSRNIRDGYIIAIRTDASNVPPIGLEVAANGNPGLISAYEEGTWTPSYNSDLNLTGTGTFTGATYTRIGNKVFVEIDEITGYSQTSDATRTVLSIDHSGLPGIDNNTQYYGGGRAKASGDDVAVIVVESSSGNDFISFAWKADGTGSLTFNAIYFWYNL